MNTRTTQADRTLRSRGSILLLVLTILPVILAFVLGGVNQAFQQRLMTDTTSFRTETIRNANSGLEYAFSELNVGGADFKTADGWDNVTTPGSHIYQYPIVTPKWKVEVKDNILTTGKLIFTGTGISGATQNTVTVTVTPPLPAGPLAFLAYAENKVMIFKPFDGTPTAVFDGYSGEEPYNAALALDHSQVKIFGQAPPYLKLNWETLADALKIDASVALVIAGDAKVIADPIVPTPGPLETPPAGYSSNYGSAVYDPDITLQLSDLVQLLGIQIIDPSSTAPTFPDPPDPGLPTAVNVLDATMLSAFGNYYQICPDDPADLLSLVALQVAGGAQVDIGCQGSDPAVKGSCAYPSYDLYGTSRSCDSAASAVGGGDPSTKTVVLSIGGPGGSGFIAPGSSKAYALDVIGAGSKINVLQPAEIHLAPTLGQEALHVAGEGITNLNKTTFGATNPAALLFYGKPGGGASAKQILLESANPFYGGIYYKGIGEITVKTEVYGALNGNNITVTGGKGIHWAANMASILGGGVISLGSICTVTTPCEPDNGSYNF